MAAWNWLDWIIVAIFLFSILMGFVRGLVSEIISIVALIAAVVIAITFADNLALNIMNYSFVQDIVARTSSSFGANTTDAISYIALGISFLVLFAGTILVAAIFKFIINLALRTGILGIGNRILGAIFGFVRGYILNVVLLFVLQLTPATNQTWWQQAYFVPYFQSSIVWLDSRVTPAVVQLKEQLQNSNINAKVQQFMNTTAPR
jgi:membrane protein required for colicin V production